MIKINALIFLFIVEFLFVFVGLAIFLFLRYSKQTLKETILKQEIQKHKQEIHEHKYVIEEQKKKNIELSGWKDMFNNLQEKFKSIQASNSKLKESIIALVPEAEKAKELEKILADFELSNKELDTCVGVLKEENERLDQEATRFMKDIKGLTCKLEDAVSKEDFNRVVSEKDKFADTLAKLREELSSRIRLYENLKNNYSMLEKEYNALYSNLREKEKEES